MCTVIIPGDILRIMEKEYSDMCHPIIEAICDEYDLPITDVKRMLINKMGMTFEIDEQQNNYRMVKRKPKKTVSDTCTRCIANLYDFQVRAPRRCIQKRDGESVFCAVHKRMFKDDRLAYGIAEGHEQEYQTELNKSELKPEPNPRLKKQIIKKIK